MPIVYGTQRAIVVAMAAHTTHTTARSGQRALEAYTMPSNNVVAAVHNLAAAAKAKGHPQHGAVLTPAQWGTLAGYPGSKASALRKHIARQSGNGCGRTGRYGAVSAQGMLNLLATGDAYTTASTAGNAAKAQAAAAKAAKLLAAAKGGTHAAKAAAAAKAKAQA